jgi:hypothetical protein
VTKIFVSCGIIGFLFLTGCASSTYRARQEQREKMASSAGLYCEWVNGDKHSDIDVELNMQMAKRCDSAKPFTLTPYKNTSDQNGIMYCCAMAGAGGAPATAATSRNSASTKATPVAGGGGPAVTPAHNSEDIVEDK